MYLSRICFNLSEDFVRLLIDRAISSIEETCSSVEAATSSLAAAFCSITFDILLIAFSREKKFSLIISVLFETSIVPLVTLDVASFIFQKYFLYLLLIQFVPPWIFQISPF